jgi:hypothetical protein
MLLISQYLRHSVLGVLALGFVLCSQSFANAGWLGFRNDTTMTLVVQESVPTPQGPRLGRPQRIFSNETFRDTMGGAANRRFQIFDAKAPDKPIYTGNFPGPTATDNVLYIIKSDGRGGITVEATKSPTSTTPKK